jgi:imidazolonepropionase-like amidohydrolase
MSRYLLFVLVFLLTITVGCTPAQYVERGKQWDRAADSLAALDYFRSNIRTIHERDREAYLDHYLRSERLVRAGAGGVGYGFDALAAGDPDAWPDTLVATHFEVMPLAPGVVYGTYRYRVVTNGQSQRGVSERVFTRSPDGEWTISVTTAFPSHGNLPVPPVAFTGATVIDGTGSPAIAGATIVVRDGRIACVGDCEIGNDVHVIDASDRWIIPGLVDAHVHYSQTGWADGRPDATDVREDFPYHEIVAELRNNPGRFHRSFLCSGVTSVFDVGGYPWTQDLPAATEHATDAPRVAASGPLLSTIDHWVNLPDSRQFVHMASEEATRSNARTIAARGSNAIKVWFLAREDTPDAADHVRFLNAAGEEARAAGLPLIVHATNLWAATEALRAGAHLLVHSVDDRVVNDAFISLILESGAIYTPTLTVTEGYVKLLSRDFDADRVSLACVHPSIRERAFRTNDLPPAAGLDVDEYAFRTATRQKVMIENLARLHRAGVPIATGTDAGNPLTLHGPSIYHEMETMRGVGLSAMDVLVASTRNGARAMGRDDFGTLEPGMWADLVILGANPLADIRNVRDMRMVVRNGEVWNRQELLPD